MAASDENLLHARRVRNIADHLLIGAGADLLLDFHAHGFQIEADLLQDVDRHALAQLNQAEQQMFGAHKIVVEAVCFSCAPRQDLLSAGREIVHCFFTHITITSTCAVQGFLSSN